MPDKPKCAATISRRNRPVICPCRRVCHEMLIFIPSIPKDWPFEECDPFNIATRELQRYAVTATRTPSVEMQLDFALFRVSILEMPPCGCKFGIVEIYGRSRQKT